jgi:stage II sporulation protein D (peptidoglycan lytic transglycosylase)
MVRVRAFPTILLCVALTGCKNSAHLGGTVDIGALPAVAARDVRVLIGSRCTSIRISVDGPFAVRNRRGTVVLRGDRAERRILRATEDPAGIVFGQTRLGAGTFDIVAERNAPIRFSRSKKGEWTLPRRYAGFLRVSLDDTGRLQVINYVNIETYVSCVLPGEVFPDFHREALRVQAIAARTYVLFEMAHSAHRPYDVKATEASQVYHGVVDSEIGRRARRATTYSRGVVATWTSPQGERIFCTYYSSCCGGVTQRAANCMPDAPDIPPLRGEVRCVGGKAAPRSKYRWPTVEISKSELTSKLASRGKAIRQLGRIERVSIVERTPSGRPKVFELTGSSGERRRMVAERFRLAVGSRRLLSANFDVKVSRESVKFINGKGFGHGVGLCQWGMQAMAVGGTPAADILQHYYPTMHLTRAY